MHGIDASRRYFQGWIDRDADALLASLTPRGTYEDPTTGGPLGGDALRAHVGRLWAAFPDLGFTIDHVAEAGPGRVAAEWTMTGTNTGSMMGLPPSGRAVRVKGADFIDIRDGLVDKVTGYFDPGEVPRQIGLEVIVQPRSVGPFTFGNSVMVHSGRMDEPGAFSVTCLEARDAAAAERVRNLSRESLLGMLGMEGFIGATTAKVGTRMVTISAWDSPEASRRVMKEGAHAEAMRPFFEGSLASHGYTSVWTPHRMNAMFVRCDACGRMNRDPGEAWTCTCGAELPAPIPYW